MEMPVSIPSQEQNSPKAILMHIINVVSPGELQEAAWSSTARFSTVKSPTISFSTIVLHSSTPVV